MKRLFRLSVFIWVMIVMAGCGGETGKKAFPITVMAPDFLRNIIDHAAGQFYRETGTRVNTLYEHPDKVIERVKTGSGIDLFFLNNSKRFKILSNDTALVEKNYLCPFRLSLVMVGRSDGPVAEDLEALRHERFRRVVIIDPAFSYEGKVTAALLSRKKVWSKIVKKLILARSPEHLTSYLATGEADAAILFESSTGNIPGITILKSFDEQLQDRLTICGAVPPSSGNKAVARAFLDLFQSPQCEIYKIEGVHPL